MLHVPEPAIGMHQSREMRQFDRYQLTAVPYTPHVVYWSPVVAEVLLSNHEVLICCCDQARHFDAYRERARNKLNSRRSIKEAASGKHPGL